jgi:hypothetical protein
MVKIKAFDAKLQKNQHSWNAIMTGGQINLRIVLQNLTHHEIEGLQDLLVKVSLG